MYRRVQMAPLSFSSSYLAKRLRRIAGRVSQPYRLVKMGRTLTPEARPLGPRGVQSGEIRLDVAIPEKRMRCARCKCWREVPLPTDRSGGPNRDFRPGETHDQRSRLDTGKED